MIRKPLSILGLGGLLLLPACAPTPRFEWGAYEQALYAYTVNPENRDAYKQSLEQAIARGRARNAVAPGLLAELGYLHLEDGDADQALQCFQEERSLFPESRVLMDRVIRQLGGGAAGGQN